MNTTISVSPEFKSILSRHGRFGERFEDILIRLLGKDFMDIKKKRGKGNEVNTA